MRNNGATNSTSMNWYALFVKTNNELSISRFLKDKLDITSLVPSRRVWKKYKSGVKVVDKPIFNSYVFVNINFRDKQWRKVYLSNGVFDFVRQCGAPAPIPEEQVLSAARIGLSDQPIHEMEYLKDLKLKDRVEVIEGPLFGAVGYFIKSSKEIGKFIIHVDLFKRSLETELEAKSIKPC